MDVSHDPRDIAARFGRLVDDLRRLLAFHGLRSGAPQHLAAFARKLEESKPFRTDFTSMLRSTRDLEQGRLTSDQMLSIIALAVGGESLLNDPASSPATTHTIALVLMLLAGIGGWSDSGDRAAPALPQSPVPRPPAASRFAAAAKSPTPPADTADTAAVDVRAFVRSDSRSEARAEGRADTGGGSAAELGPERHADVRWQPRPETPVAPDPLPSEARPEARAEVPHIVRREPLSEIVRPPAELPSAPVPITPRTPPEATAGAPRLQERPRAAAAAAQRWPEPQARPDAWRPPEPSRSPEAQKLLPEAQAPPRTPEPRAVADTAPGPAAAARSIPDDGSAHAAVIASTHATAPHQEAPSDPKELEDRIAEQPTETTNRRRSGSRKLTLDAALAIAAVALLAFGVFEGVHSRHTAAPAAVATAPAPQPADRPTAAEPENSLPTDLGAAAGGTAPAPASESASDTTTAPRSNASSARATAPHLSAPTHAAPAEDLQSPDPAASRHASSGASTPRLSAKATAAEPGLETASLAVPRGPVPVPEATMNQQLVAAHKPVYPPAAVAQHVQGTVVLRAFVSTDGTIRRTDVLAGPPSLINSALAAASWRRYRPFVVNGRPVEVQTEITMHYALPGGNP